jgi:uncharacterized protein (DUF1501 family)
MFFLSFSILATQLPKTRFKAATDLRAVLKGVLCDHLRADERMLAQAVFPGSEAVKPIPGLVV